MPVAEFPITNAETPSAVATKHTVHRQDLGRAIAPMLIIINNVTMTMRKIISMTRRVSQFQAAVMVS